MSIIDISTYKKGDIIFPDIIKNTYNLTMEETYLALEEIKKDKQIQIVYIPYCDDCNEYVMSKIFETISCIPEFTECDKCHKILDGFEKSIVVYKVL